MNPSVQALFEPDKTEYFDQLFETQDCSSKTIQNKLFENCHFKHCNFDNAHLVNCRFVNCEFTDCGLNTITLPNTMFSDVVFSNSKLMGINWSTAKWPQVKLSSSISFYLCNISHSSFFGLNISEINIQKCKSHDVDFREADLSNSHLVDTDFDQSQFIRTKLTSADFSGAFNYNIDITLNDVKKAIFTFPDVINLLLHFEIKINGFPTALES